MSVCCCCCLFRYRLTPKTFTYTFVSVFAWEWVKSRTTSDRTLYVWAKNLIWVLWNTYLLTYLLTYAMVQDIIWKADCHSAFQNNILLLYGTRRFITVLTKACHWTLSWASRIQFVTSIHVSLGSILMLYSHLRLGLPTGLLTSVLATKPCKHLSPPPCVPHVPPTSSSSI
jgi:hypothetical protein